MAAFRVHSPQGHDAGARVLVVGGGPAGLAVAACLKREGVSYIQVDRHGRVGGAYRKMFAATELLSPAKFTQLPGLPISASYEYVTAGQYFRYLERYAAHHQLEIVRANVETIVPVDDGEGAVGFRVRFEDARETRHYAIVVLATGIVEHPVIPTISGVDAEHGAPEVIHARDWTGSRPFRGRKLLIVGAGMSGVEIAEQCALAGLSVTISSRRPVRFWRRRVFGVDVHHIAHLFSHRLPRWIAGSYCHRLPALRPFDRGFRSWVHTGAICQRGEVQGFIGKEATFADGSKERFDVVVLATGYRWHPPCLPTGVETGMRGQPITDGGMIRAMPGLFLIGAPCGRILPSEFLHGIKHDAPVITKAILRRLSDLGEHSPGRLP